MSAEIKKLAKAKLAIVLATSFVTGALADEVQLPEAPRMTAAQLQERPDGAGQPFVIGPPVEATDEKGRIYRDPSQPLTIGEMSDIQKEKAVADFLRKAGFTTEKPPEPPKPEAPKAPERVESKLSVKSVFAREGQEPFAEIETAAGSILKASVGTRISDRISIAAVDGRQIALSVIPEPRPGCEKGARASKRKATSCNLAPSLVFLMAGDQYTWFE
ncbi:hypothetical protein [Hydrogenophaga sp. NFH-34]|uniref:hypothetical protein n=1 Tax=Hydrogenophaga sp. NFH-34 TaxID=2744446 RepID=UPI001F24A22A|nr:hypothetical protein [Hydrogenophaga sp. NFH-34]